MSFSEEVLDYVKGGYSVIPISPKGKEPLVLWKEFQTRRPEEEEIKNWWKKWPDANVGIVTGSISGVVVIDCDSEEAVNRFVEDYPEAGDTLQVKTGKGRHFYFRSEPGIRNDVGSLLGSGIDIRGEGGFVVAPPSVHENGTVYQWLNNYRPVPLPAKLKEILVNQSKDGKPSNGGLAQPIGEKIPEHQRNTTLTSLAGSMRFRGTGEEAILAALLVENSQKCDPPLEKGEVEGIARSVAQYEPGQVPVNSFPHYREQTVRNELKILTWGEFLSTTPEEREYTIDGILPVSGLAVLLGRGKQGKSTLAIQACRAIATGQDFLERQTKKKRIVYVNYEMAEDYLHTLLGAGDSPEEAFIVNRPEPKLSLETIERIMAKVEDGPGVMVIDSFRGAFKLAGDAENSAGGAGVILRQLQELAVGKGWLILLIHHSNKGGKEGTDSVSGTSDWIAAPDVLWTWSRPKPENSGTLFIEGRIPPVEPMAVRLTLEECSYVGTVKEDQEQIDKEEILAALTDEGQTTKEIAEATGKASGTVGTRLKTLYELGLIERVGRGKKGKAFKYLLIHSAQDSPLSAETNFGELNQMQEGDQRQATRH
ncbi:MAG: bifunctional DNA primase/polymerase [Deltaproteobacteria bacterium]|nr:bifunctional DNA primase/polymerase [Deltaproteobacteria bacterium]